MFRESESPTTDAEVLALCHAHGTAATFIVAQSAAQRMVGETVSPTDLSHVLKSAVVASRASDGRWTVVGSDIDGTKISITVTFDGDRPTVL